MLGYCSLYDAWRENKYWPRSRDTVLSKWSRKKGTYRGTELCQVCILSFLNDEDEKIPRGPT